MQSILIALARILLALIRVLKLKNFSKNEILVLLDQ